MLPRENRLKTRFDFDRVRREGKVIQTPSFGLATLKETNPLISSKFGMIISNKISKKAVERNHIRRILRDAIRELLPMLNSGFMCVILAKSAIMHKSNTEIKKDIQEVFKKTGLLK